MDVTAPVRLCEGCGEPLPASARPNKRHHDSACRTRAYARRRRAEERAAERANPLTRMSALAPEQQEALDRATSEVRLVALVAKASQTQWRAAAWLLERRHPERWGMDRRPELPPPPLRPEEEDAFRLVDELAERRRRKPDDY